MIYAKLREMPTPRLILRKFCPEDVSLYFQRVTSRPEVTRYMLWDTHQTISDTEKILQSVLQRYTSGSCYRWCIALAEDKSPIGAIELLRFDAENHTCSFAYMIGSDYWGMGYGTEALCAALKFAFEDMKILTVTADHMAANPASGKVMQKAGMRFCRMLPGKYQKNGQPMDACEYSITREEWLQHQKMN